MSELSPIQIETLFDRTRCAHASCVRRSRVRSVGTFLLLLLFVALITGYSYVTDPDRVREISERYLARLAGGPVTVKRASLSIFEGLRLDGIRIHTSDADPQTDDSLLFEARSLHVGYDPQALLMGRIEATRIVALEPRVHLVEDVDAGRWNFQQLDRPPEPAPPPGEESSAPVKLPEVLLRSARIDYAQIVDGVRSQVGTLNIEGQVTPALDGRYTFRLQSRGGTSGVFPIAEGWLEPGKQVGLVLRGVEFVDEIKTVLPAVVRRVWDEHRLAGRIGETRISYFQENGRTGFRVEADFDGVRLVIPTGRYLGPDDHQRMARWDDAMARIASPVLGGSPFAAGLVGGLTPTPLQMDEVDGTILFTNDKIQIDSLIARIENNRFNVSGVMHGYQPTSPFAVKIQSLKTENLRLPESPRYIPSLPWPAQEIYYRFRPRGDASFWLTIERDRPGGKPKLAGEVRIIDAAFRFERFPYPIERASGVIRIADDPGTGEPMLEIISLAGQGYAGGGNERAVVELAGKISPLDETAGADIRVSGRNVISTPDLIASLPREARRTVRSFDPDHTGKLPTFNADFVCSIQRPVGLKQPWEIVTQIDVRNASGLLKAFPYPLKNLDATLIVHDNHIDLQRAFMPEGGGEVELSGRIDWSNLRPDGAPLVQPDLKLRVRNVNITDAMIAALPEERRGLASDMKLRGVIDIDGRIVPKSPESDDIALDVELKLRNGAATLHQGKVELKDIALTAQVSPTRSNIPTLKARFGNATIDGRATIDWSGRPQATVAAAVRGLAIDDRLLAALPETLRQSIGSLGAAGTVDVDIDYAADGDKPNYRLSIRPRELALKPAMMPVALDKLQGELVVDGGRVVLKDIVARAGDALVHASGTIDHETGRADLALAARDLKLTGELREAMPPVVQRLLASADLKGAVSFDLQRLVVAPHRSGSPNRPSDITFDGTLWLQKATMNVGAPMTDVDGVLRAKGLARGGKLVELSGDVSFDEMQLAGRRVDKLTATILKPADQDVLQISKIDGRIAGGQVGGQIDSILSEKDPRFGLSLVIRNASVAALTGELDKPIDGRLTASLSLEGKWDDPVSRRGRGDVIVEGKEMYRVPVLFGLMQIANLSLPIEAPLNQAGVRYTVEGQRINLEAIDLRSATSAMQGTGWLDFKTKQMQMTLLMGNPATDNVPIFGELLRGARQDLLQIRVRGSLQEPKVGASAFNTITATVDEVLRGGE